jgi:hypothetical protein
LQGPLRFVLRFALCHERTLTLHGKTGAECSLVA